MSDVLSSTTVESRGSKQQQVAELLGGTRPDPEVVEETQEQPAEAEVEQEVAEEQVSETIETPEDTEQQTDMSQK